MKNNILHLIIIYFFTNTLLFSQSKDEFYKAAFVKLSDMLEGKSEVNFKEAVFSVENAYMSGNLDTVFINQEIRFLVQLTQKVVESRDLIYTEKDKKTVSIQAGIFSVLNDSIPIQNQFGENFVRLPYSYDFNDVFGHQHWENMFVSKLLQSSKGNCHSLPYLYKILAQELGVDAHLALAPNHVYIKLQNQKNGWYNTELTSGIFPIDAWLMASGFVHIDAIVNGVYLKALTEKESIALCLVDLAQGYEKSISYDKNLVIKMTDKALEYFPNLVGAMLVQTETKGKIIENKLAEHYTDFSEVHKYPETSQMLLEIQNQLRKIHDIGYRQMPEEMYLEWLTSLKNEKDKYSNKNISNFNPTQKQ